MFSVLHAQQAAQQQRRPAKLHSSTAGSQQAAHPRCRPAALPHPTAARPQEKRKQSWNEKEKKKRKEGKVARDGSTVEEEKRIARNFGVYSGFD
jgi:hypothetical protein